MRLTRTLALAVMFIAGLSGCQNPTWNFDNFQVTGEFRLDGSCSATLDGRSLGSGTYGVFRGHNVLPDKTAYGFICNLPDSYLTYTPSATLYDQGAGTERIQGDGWPRASSARLSVDSMDQQIRAMEGETTLRNRTGDHHIDASLRFRGKRYEQHF